MRIFVSAIIANWYSSGHLIPMRGIIGIKYPLEYLHVYRWLPLFPYFLLLWSLSTVKLQFFSLYLFVCFLKDYHNYFLVHAQL